tara:strand:- start:11 stop:445 length:435 start_codon:yes stop_codon:yes gene_type:complete
MKKILILFLFLSACGYQPLYNANLINVEFNKIDLSGDVKINRKIISTLNINESNNTNKEISIDSSKSITITSRDAQGQPATYRTSVNVTVSIKDQNKTVKTKSFNENFSYNNIENKYDLSVYQKDVQDNLIRKIIDDLIVYINL